MLPSNTLENLSSLLSYSQNLAYSNCSYFSFTQSFYSIFKKKLKCTFNRKPFGIDLYYNTY